MDRNARKVMLATKEPVDADLELIGAKSIANAWNVSLHRFKQLAAIWHLTSESRAELEAELLADTVTPNYIKEGCLSRAPLIPKDRNGRYVLSAWRAMALYSSEVALASERPGPVFDPDTHKIVGKDNPFPIILPARPRAPKAREKAANGKSRLVSTEARVRRQLR